MARILVVDDDPDILNLIQFHLRQGGHQVAACTSAEQAIEVVDGAGSPDLAVLDVSMPGMSGLELLKVLRLREGMGQLPIIFLSARVQPTDVDAGRALGATYVTKPFSGEALIAAVNQAVPARDVSRPKGERG